MVQTRFEISLNSTLPLFYLLHVNTTIHLNYKTSIFLFTSTQLLVLTHHSSLDAIKQPSLLTDRCQFLQVGVAYLRRQGLLSWMCSYCWTRPWWRRTSGGQNTERGSHSLACWPWVSLLHTSADCKLGQSPPLKFSEMSFKKQQFIFVIQ